MHFIALICSAFIVVGCCLPWIQIGALFTNNGYNNPDGAILLVFGLISFSLALFNLIKNQNKFKATYIIIAIIGIACGIFDLQEVQKRVQQLSGSLNQLGTLFGANSGWANSEMRNFVGSGLYVILAASAILFFVGLSALFSKQAAAEVNINTSDSTLCIECGKYFVGEPKFCPNCGKPTKFNS